MSGPTPDVRRGDIAHCAQCGYVYTFTAREDQGCRRCGSRTLRRWRPVMDDRSEPPDEPGRARSA